MTEWQEKLRLMNIIKKEFNELDSYGWKLNIELPIVKDYLLKHQFILVNIWWECYNDNEDNYDDEPMDKTFKIDITNYRMRIVEIRKYMLDNWLT